MTLHGGAQGDTKTIEETLEDADNNLSDVHEQVDDKTSKRVSLRVEEVVADKGYHSNDVLTGLEESEIRAYIAEPKRGTRRWKGKEAEKKAVYANRRRMKCRRSKGLMKKRGELLERPFAHMLETGGMRRLHLRRHDNILKRVLVQAAAANLGLLMRTLFGVGSPRSLQGRRGRLRAVAGAFSGALTVLLALWFRRRFFLDSIIGARRLGRNFRLARSRAAGPSYLRCEPGFTTGC